METEHKGAEHGHVPELVEEEGLKKIEAKPIFQGYKITFDSQQEAEDFIKEFWTENFPETTQSFESDMWNPAIHDQLTHRGERTTFVEGHGGALGEEGHFTILLAGNGQALKPTSVDWLISKGYLVNP